MAPDTPAPKPPTERGWRGEHGPELDIGPGPGRFVHRSTSREVVVPMGLWVDLLDRVSNVSYVPDLRAVDTTFENETRLHR